MHWICTGTNYLLFTHHFGLKKTVSE